MRLSSESSSVTFKSGRAIAKGSPGKPAARSDIHDGCTLREQRQGGQGVHEVLDRNALLVGDRRQVHLFIPFHEHVRITSHLRRLGDREIQSELPGIYDHSIKPFLLHFSLPFRSAVLCLRMQPDLQYGNIRRRHA